MKLPGGMHIDSPSWPLLQAQVSYFGITTANGNAGGTTLVDALCSTAGLQPSYVGNLIKILDGAAAGQIRPIFTHALGTGTITVVNAWTDQAGAAEQILAGTRYVILSMPGANSSTDPGVTQIFQVNVTAAANAGQTVLATITDASCTIKSIVVKANGVTTVDLTSAAVQGGAAQVMTFLSAIDAAVGNINAVDEQIYWEGTVELGATATIIMDLQGTGATAVDLTVTIEYYANVAGGHLA